MQRRRRWAGERLGYAPRPVTAPVVSVSGLTKIYKVHERTTGLGATFRSLVRRKYKDVPAVAGIEFGIASGEIVGFLGPNGAGKTTTLKMLSGLLFPTSGDAQVMGHVPWSREDRFLRRMTLLMGNRTQLVWDIPAADSFLVLKQIYGIGDAQVVDRRRLAEPLRHLCQWYRRLACHETHPSRLRWRPPPRRSVGGRPTCARARAGRGYWP